MEDEQATETQRHPEQETGKNARLTISELVSNLERQLGGDVEAQPSKGRRSRRPLSEQAREAGSGDLPLRERVLRVLEISPIGAEKLAQAIGMKILVLRAELREMEREGLIQHDGEHYGLGPCFIAANPVSETAMNLVRGAFRQRVMAHGDITLRTGLGPETIRRTMRWLAQKGEAKIVYIGVKPIYHWIGDLVVGPSTKSSSSNTVASNTVAAAARHQEAAQGQATQRPDRSSAQH